MGKREFRISPSRLYTWRTCPRAYKFHYEDHARAIKSLPLIFGGEIHRMLDKFYDEDFESPESFQKRFGYKWRAAIAGDFLTGKQKRELTTRSFFWTPKKKQEDEQDEPIEYIVGDHTKLFFITDEKEMKRMFFQYSKIGKALLAKFYERHKHQRPPDEKELRIYFDFRGYPMLGVPDRIDRKDGKVYITDYKTDKFPPASKDVLDSNFQLTAYSAAFRAKFGEIEEALLYYLVREGKVYGTRRLDSKPFDDLEKQCEGLMIGLQKREFKPKYGYQCGLCDYLKTCSGDKETGELFDEDSIFDSSIFGDIEA